ncbi:unnamed protein product [Rotaria sordida]|uniref:G-protein coupled receptors family 1 profile domain-containing protein n=1 Tax=Rotaria sordida TaxID=392033 RepID=A0A814M6D3_9BILA|nr:unnamed protein product [Rotaria sordida]CAF1261522.1 unnamed protein product [Rotaria sordida]
MFLGLIGHIINIIIFTRPNLISNSCCNYCLASSCVSIIQILFGQLFRMLKAGYHIPIPSLWWCRIRTFFLYSTSLASIILITLASADRYVSSCSQVKYRQWANIKVARRLILIVLIISAVCRSHILSFFVIDEDEEDECWAPGTTDYRLIFDIVFLITHGLIFPVLLGTFGFLTIYNIRQRRQSDQQNGASILRQHRIRDFQRMTLIQTASAIVFTLPYAIHKLYRTVTASPSKSPENLAWERLIMSIVRLLWFLHDSGAFYIYSLSSVKFRHELLKFLKKHRPRRASVILYILKTTLKLIEKSEFNVNELSVLFDDVLNPIAAQAQSFWIWMTETTSNTINGNVRIELTLSQGTNATSSQLTLSDQLYRQAKIDEENRHLKKKNRKLMVNYQKTRKKSSKKSDIAVINDNDDDIYPTVKITRDDESPEGATESGNEDNDHDVHVGKNKKYNLHRARNIDLSEKPIQSIPTLPPLTS